MDSILNYKRNEDEDFYNILNCDELSTVEQIHAEYKAHVLQCHPDKNLNDPTAVQRFARLQRAKDVLCNEESRKKYDQWKNSGIAMSYQQWCSHRDHVHTSMHWASVKKKPMLEEENATPGASDIHRKSSPESSHPSHSTQSNPTFHLVKERRPKPIPWDRDPASDMLTKFRNYDI